ncbi:unnamed protein product [Rotaria magnacalcarata]|uniref:Integrase catalytic domain-containing protein n=1 Tax=Rotaria magnacalcarata TaxID=392030 RepID=A0A815H7T5_9BILA|nr:unnamed protein product [Rotaria magnacalcarata]CAF4008063.1 unnamed protein product [Rotaria magnacalcarata]CAF4063602.1 unnamed protein product [Rotaria magnacalcarata]
MGINRKFTANYHPQTNMSERVNRTLKAQIDIYAQHRPGLWDKELQKLAFAIRTSVNDTTGDTPAYLNLGRDPVIPLDLIINQPVPDSPSNTPEYTFIQLYRTKLAHNLQMTYHFVREHSEIHKLSQKAAYDTHTINRHFHVGDLVWIQIPTPRIENTNITHKLRPKFQGPCRLLEQLSPSTFIAMRISDHVNIGSTNIDHMKPYYDPQTIAPNGTTTPDNSSPTPVRRYPLRVRRPTRPT